MSTLNFLTFHNCLASASLDIFLTSSPPILTPSLCDQGYKYNQRIANFIPQHEEEMAMKIYLFNPETGVYLGEDFADKHPKRLGEYILPHDATDIAPPPVEKGQVLVFNMEERRWEVRNPPLNRSAAKGPTVLSVVLFGT
jgi:hypothetical protein